MSLVGGLGVWSHDVFLTRDAEREAEANVEKGEKLCGCMHVKRGGDGNLGRGNNWDKGITGITGQGNNGNNAEGNDFCILMR